ncbi:hypothetical protein ACX0G9_11350 [Flavitalea flava]
MNIESYESVYQWYTMFFLYTIFSFIKEPGKFVYIIQAALLSVLIFYVKVNLGVTVIFMFLMVLTYLVIRKKLNIKTYLSILILYFIGFFSGARILNVNLKGYVAASLQLIDGYNDAMPVDSEPVIFSYAALLIIVIIVSCIMVQFLASCRKKEFIKNLDYFFIYGILLLNVYILFKSSFVRGDGHIFQFFKCIALNCGLLYIFTPKSPEKKGNILVIGCWVVLIIATWAMEAIPGSYNPLSRITKFTLVPKKIEEARQYFNGIKDYHHALVASDSLIYNNNELKTIIGSHSVDVIPIEVSKVYFNGLHYNPRPVIQSYSAYTQYLDSLNYEKYMSPNAPDYILFTMYGMDNRFAFFDESKTKLALLNHYRIAGNTNGYLLLRKRPAPREMVNVGNDTEFSAKLGQEITIKKSDDLQYSRVYVKYNFWGWLQSILFRSPGLTITFTLENGEISTFKAVKPILKGGVLLNKFIDTDQDFQMLMQSDGRLNTNVKKIKIESDPINSGFIREIKIVTSYYKFDTKSISEIHEDSLAIAELFKGFDRYQPRRVDSIPFQQDSFRYGIDKLTSHSPIIKVEGWAFRPNANNRNIVVKVILRSQDSLYELPTEKTIRGDLPVVFKRQDLDNAGFSATVVKSAFPPGDYQLGLIIRDSINGKSWINYLDPHIMLRGKYNIEKISALNTEALNKNNIRYNIDSIGQDEDLIFVEGWASVQNSDSGRTITNLVLQDHDKGVIYRINTDTKKRIDVVSLSKGPFAAYNGFSVLIPKKGLPQGTYIIGIEKVNSSGNDRSLIFSDRKIKVDPQ